MKVLFATSEAQPLIRAGGLAEVSWGLPRALRQLGHDVRLILPGYLAALELLDNARPVGRVRLPGLGTPATILAGEVPGTGLPIYLLDAPALFEREGGPYTNADGDEWADNAQRFACLGRAIAALALGRAELDWQPEVVHCNDWQTGLAPALIALETPRPATLFTVHNMVTQGLFSWETFHNLDLPRTLWHRHGLEHYGNFAFIKGGLAYSDRINTVSPTYAEELKTEALGMGMEDVVNRHAERLVGILNGIDPEAWDPARDPHLVARYDRDELAPRQDNKPALQARLGLAQDPHTPLLVHAGRLIRRRGSDLLLEVLPELDRLGLQLVVRGRGERSIVDAWRKADERWPWLKVVIGDDDPLHHLMAAGADLLVVPSRIEPCGLEQLHGLRYGSVPVARQTGGLADSVVDAGDGDEPRPEGNGFLYQRSDAESLLAALVRGVERWRAGGAFWHRLMVNGMAADHTWLTAARRYQRLYQAAQTYRNEQQA